jgi:glutaredoxin
LAGTISLGHLGTCYEWRLWIVAEVKVTLIGKPGCHLCERAHAVISEVIGGQDIQFEELSLLDDPDLMAKYSEEIPVILVNGKVHDFLRVDRDRLRAAIAGARLS